MRLPLIGRCLCHGGWCAETLADEITKAVACPTIGIGASAQCDGQILVGEDMLGATGGPYPKFSNYARFYEEMEKAVQNYAGGAHRAFPQAAHVYTSLTVEMPVAAHKNSGPAFKIKTGTAARKRSKNPF